MRPTESTASPDTDELSQLVKHTSWRYVTLWEGPRLAFCVRAVPHACRAAEQRRSLAQRRPQRLMVDPTAPLDSRVRPS